MKMFNRLIRLIFFSLLLAIVACAPEPYKKPDINRVWPLPPDQPRVKYVDRIRSSLDIGVGGEGTASLFYGAEDAEKLDKPYGVAVDRQGIIYVTDIGKVMAFDRANKKVFYIGVERGDGKLRVPLGIWAAEDNRIFVADSSSKRVFIYKDRKYIGEIGGQNELENPSGVAVDDRAGLAYVVDSKKGMVSVYSLKDYSRLRTIGKRGRDKGEFNFPSNIAVDAAGKIYVVDTGNNRVQIFDEKGEFVRTFGYLGDGPGAFPRPKGIALDSEGHIYVVDAAFANVQIFDSSGALLMHFGDHGDKPGDFWLPAGIAIDGADRIYVIDQYPGLIQIFQYMGEKWHKSKEKGN